MYVLIRMGEVYLPFLNILLILLTFVFCNKPFIMSAAYRYLALGDSYTIGEALPITESFPYQLMAFLRNENIAINAPEIIAKTGWTTQELQTAIQHHPFLSAYDFVTLLIGVNNQYRGYAIATYIKEFESLLQQAIQFANGIAHHVAVLSIPDWGVTPFAHGRDGKQIAIEIDEYNLINKNIAAQYKVHYIDITGGSRAAAIDNTLVATDGLHPSAKLYQIWAAQLLPLFKKQIIR
jgi:lysophospholipase L1-like esterase